MNPTEMDDIESLTWLMLQYCRVPPEACQERDIGRAWIQAQKDCRRLAKSERRTKDQLLDALRVMELFYRID